MSRYTDHAENNNGDEEVDYIHRRVLDGESLAHVHRRLDSAYDILHETRERMIVVHELLVQHIETEKQIRPALEELATLWKGSKLIIPILSAIAIGLAGAWAWVKAEIFK